MAVLKTAPQVVGEYSGVGPDIGDEVLYACVGLLKKYLSCDTGAQQDGWLILGHTLPPRGKSHRAETYPPKTADQARSAAGSLRVPARERCRSIV